MKAVGFKQHLPINNQASLIDFEEPIPQPNGHDLLVQVEGVSVNPVDTGVRRFGRGIRKTPKVIGWDAVGTVKKIGSEVTLFREGDKVFYAGDFKRAGSDSDYQLVDERIVGRAPTTLSNPEIVAMPLTSLTAWEALFEKLQINPNDRQVNSHKTILIINGAGGVGSVATQLAKLAGLRVIATASREETKKWVIAHGADLVANHRNNLVTEVHRLGVKNVDYILELNNIDQHWNEMADLIKPSGRVASITENKHPIDLKKMTKKRVTFAWEWMYSKSYYSTDDEITQHKILNHIADLLDNKKLKPTETKTLSPINAANLRRAHELVESGRMIGKVVLVR
ncbi:zinc-binding alcohol dehydrogenase family protein [Lentilactobacillus sp. Marseille-Q4993]|uniref:zinc-binding alcohol dehydrogenase family protein n=1 Tax=Lentilactobacillus sp. Marseille-Q4993 TaxID=3039492 RepID=UPI0024BC30F0|nr:zinc-binding alcohol dehydrogenase family protein [Lentilactobacillus sp. Marseille-Q4993]